MTALMIIAMYCIFSRCLAGLESGRIQHQQGTLGSMRSTAVPAAESLDVLSRSNANDVLTQLVV